jgi:DNA modification methylase
MAANGQVLVNLGLIHRDNEVIPYWDGWLDWMRTQGWRRFAWYVWDQGPGLPGDWNGRLAPSFEFVFHFNRQAPAGQQDRALQSSPVRKPICARTAVPRPCAKKMARSVAGLHAGTPTQETKIPDSVIRIMRHKGKIGQDIDHPAVFPVALPEHILETYTDAGDIVFEPFCGSGTTLLAAQRTGRVVRATEIAPEYVDVTVKRFQQNFPEVPVTLGHWADL